MGILGTMTVNFAANIDGLKQSRIDHSTIELDAKSAKCPTLEEIAKEVAMQLIESYPVYLDKARRWHPRQLCAEEWEYDLHGFSSRVFFLKDGRVGMMHDGSIIVKSIEEWMKNAQETQEQET